MIELTSLSKQKIWINHEHIRMLEVVPDTIICFVDGSRLPVLESPNAVRDKIFEFKKMAQSSWNLAIAEQ